MSDSRFWPTAIDPVYMTEAEANAVMDLWAEIQRQEASRQSLVTVHDVAEAIQVSPEQVQRLLQAVRLSEVKEAPKPSLDPVVLPGSDRMWAWSGVVSFLAALGILGLVGEAYSPLIIAVALVCVLWSLFMTIFYLTRAIDRWIAKQAHRNAAQTWPS